MFRSLGCQRFHVCRTVLVVLALALLGLGAINSSAQERSSTNSAKLGQTSFKTGRVDAEYVNQNGQKLLLQQADTMPLSAATVDLNHDGYPDLIAGYGTAGGGLVVVHLANPEAFAPALPESLSGIARGEFPPPFEATALVIPVPTRPDLLASGDFNGDGTADLLFATQGGRCFFLLPKDGNGNFGTPLSVAVPGKITALATGSLHGATGGPDTILGIDGDLGSALVIYYSAKGGVTTVPATHSVGGRITGLAIGDFDGDSYRDVALVAGDRLMLLHGDAPSLSKGADNLETIPLPFGVSAVAAGNFAGEGRSTQLAVLTKDRGVVMLSRPESDGALHGYAGSRAALGAARIGTARPARRQAWRPDQSPIWAVAGNAQVTAADLTSTKLFAARISGSQRDDLLVTDTGNSRVTLLTAGSARPAAGGRLTQLRPLSLDSSSAVVAVVPMRLNLMGSPGLVMLTAGDLAPVAFTSQAGVTYHVTTLGDSQTGSCTTPGGVPASSSCTTLRAAIIAANANPGQDLVVFDANGTITLSVPGQDDNAQAGDLDVTDSLTIMGNGTSSTIIQGGTNGSNGIDKVFSFNPLGLQPGFAVSISGLTIQFGRNTFTDFTVGDDEGGAFDFDAGAQDGAGSLSVSNCNILSNSTLNGDGGAIALFNGGTVAIANTTITGNNANTQDPNAWYGFYGGGVFVADPGIFAENITVANSTISGNTLSATNMKVPIQFGGGICSFAPGIALHAVTISGNQANGDGGGLYSPFGTLIVDQGSLVSGNVSGGFGGGIYGVSVVNGSTLTNNKAASGGGALYSNGAANIISNSRITGNTSTHGAPAMAADSSMEATIAASNNWWGSNASPDSLVAPGIVTYSPWLVMTFSASPASIYTQGTSILTARVATGSDGSTGYQIADGTPVSVAGAPGSISPASPTTSSGAASSTYTAGPAAGTASVSATLDNQTLTASINVTAAPVPTLNTIAPATGVQGATVPVTLTGTNFVTGATVATGNTGITVSNMTIISATQITATFTIAPSAALGATNVTVTTSGGASGPIAFTVNSPSVPTLTSVGPPIGGPGTSIPVTLTGTNLFAGATIATSNPALAVSEVNVVSVTQITATFTIAAGAAAGPVNITVTTASGSSAPAIFTVIVSSSDVTSVTRVNATGVVQDRVTGRYKSTISVTNTGAATIAGPMYILFTSLTLGSTLPDLPMFNGLPYATVTVGAGLAPGATSSTVTISFLDPTNARIGYTTMRFNGGFY